MKTIKITMLAFLCALSISVFADVEKASFATSAQCEMCTESITKTVQSLEGVKKVMLNEVTKEVKVKFDDAIVSLMDIKQAVANIGYTAGEVQPTKETVDALAPCCKPTKSCCSADAAKSCTKEK